MDIIITEWALQSYLDLLAQGAFDRQDYWSTLRPDVEKLHHYPADPAFSNNKFWSPAGLNGAPQVHDFKMKWHNVGSGRVQLRLPVAIYNNEALLCRAYVKTDAAAEARQLAVFKTHINKIVAGNYHRRGKL